MSNWIETQNKSTCTDCFPYVKASCADSDSISLKTDGPDSYAFERIPQPKISEDQDLAQLSDVGSNNSLQKFRSKLHIWVKFDRFQQWLGHFTVSTLSASNFQFHRFELGYYFCMQTGCFHAFLCRFRNLRFSWQSKMQTGKLIPMKMYAILSLIHGISRIVCGMTRRYASWGIWRSTEENCKVRNLIYGQSIGLKEPIEMNGTGCYFGQKWRLQ